ncbi:toxin-antitoxin system YwqK family antitoxin [Winogradskyella undariae]|uniref:toxin-antitoxin system YwqK family antitoxin n=1 Tax=Winogradskyella undariae TaxID=1285465 RepID=UPI0015CBC06C|nr:hypothetical protein [Winogradskyella undariae]
MKNIVFIVFLFFNLWQSYGQNQIASAEYLGETYFIYPESQDEKYTNLNTLTWKDKIIRKKYNLNEKQSTDGKWIQFYKKNNSIPAKTFELKKGNLNGEYKQYYKNGIVELIEQYSNENIFNLCLYYYKNGNIKDSIKYKLNTSQNGHIFSNKTFMKSYYENRVPRKIENYDSLGVKNGNWKEYYENGKLKKSINYSNKVKIKKNEALPNHYGELIGKYITYYNNGQIKSKLYYKNNKIENRHYCYYYLNGQKSECGYLRESNSTYPKPIKYGLWTEYYENGKIKSIGKYANDTYIFCGVVPYDREYIYKIGEWKYYYENGQIMTSGIYLNPEKNIRTNCGGGANIKISKINKNWISYDKNGNKIDNNDLINLNLIIDNEMILNK